MTLDTDDIKRLNELRDGAKNGIPAVRDFLRGYPQIFDDDTSAIAISILMNHVVVIETIDKHYVRKK